MSKNVYSRPLSIQHRAICDDRAHFGITRHAVDFLCPEGTIIVAAADGEVWDIEQTFSEGGDDPSLANKSNYVTIKHANGEYSQYCHIGKHGSLVKVGDKVTRGQKIALSGNTGYSTEPHLHFHVFEIIDADPDWDTIPVTWDDNFSITYYNKGVPTEKKVDVRA